MMEVPQLQHNDIWLREPLVSVEIDAKNPQKLLG